MSLRKTLLIICLIISVLCLAAGYTLAGQWIGAILATLMAPAWLLARKYPQSWLLFVCLLVSVGLAAAGILVGASPLLMIFGSGISLAVWDLVSLDVALGSDSSREQTRHFENKHLQALVLAVGFGLVVTLLGRLVSLQIPFIVLIVLIAFTLLALDRVWGYIKKQGNWR